MRMRKLLTGLSVIVACLSAGNAARAQTPDKAPDKVSFGTNWVAEAEHGGFYQAVADGTYRKYGLDVTIVPGGYVWGEATYASLSTIARAITGTAWNGPRFFGMREMIGKENRRGG